MKRLYLVLFCIFTLSAKNIKKGARSAPKNKTKKVTVQENQPYTLEGHVKSIVKPWMKKNNIPGVAIALYHNDESYLLSYGYADLEKKKPITQNTIFEIGSVSKVFTCLLVAQEVLAGHMYLSDPINKHIPALAGNKRLRKTTLEKLCTHTSTMPFDVPAWVTSKDSFYTYMRTWKPAQKEELWFQYSNPGIELLRVALEEQTHESINDLFIQRILIPLNMSPISINVPAYYMPHYADCLNKVGEPARYWDDGLLHGAAAVRASSADMLKFLKAAIGLPGTPASISQAMQLTQKQHIQVAHIRHGLGWEVKDVDNLVSKNSISWGFPAQKITRSEKPTAHRQLFEKTGTTRGFHTYIGVIPGKKSGIVIMINRTMPQGWNSIKKIGRGILFELKN